MRGAGCAGREGVHLDACVCGVSVSDSVDAFIAAHETVFVVEQNRDAQMRSMLINELDVESGQTGTGAALRRHADHGALHRGRHPQGDAVVNWRHQPKARRYA